MEYITMNTAELTTDNNDIFIDDETLETYSPIARMDNGLDVGGKTALLAGLLGGMMGLFSPGEVDIIGVAVLTAVVSGVVAFFPGFIYGFKSNCFYDAPKTKAELLAEEELLAEPKIFTHRHTVVLSALEMLGDDMSSQARIYKQSSHAERAMIEEVLIVAKIII